MWRVKCDRGRMTLSLTSTSGHSLSQTFHGTSRGLRISPRAFREASAELTLFHLIILPSLSPMSWLPLSLNVITIPCCSARWRWCRCFGNLIHFEALFLRSRGEHDPPLVSLQEYVYDRHNYAFSSVVSVF